MLGMQNCRSFSTLGKRHLRVSRQSGSWQQFSAMTSRCFQTRSMKPTYLIGVISGSAGMLFNAAHDKGSAFAVS